MTHETRLDQDPVLGDTQAWKAVRAARPDASAARDEAVAEALRRLFEATGSYCLGEARGASR